MQFNTWIEQNMYWSGITYNLNPVTKALILPLVVTILLIVYMCWATNIVPWCIPVATASLSFTKKNTQCWCRPGPCMSYCEKSESQILRLTSSQYMSSSLVRSRLRIDESSSVSDTLFNHSLLLNLLLYSSLENIVKMENISHFPHSH